MTSSNKLILLMMAGLVACTPARSPLQGDDGATFAVLPDRVRASAELNRASSETFGRPSAQTLHFNVCLQSLATGQSVANGTPFAIADDSGTEIERSADANGCVHWDETHAVSPLAPERNVRLERRIRALRNQRGAVRVAFNVKPWIEGDGAMQPQLNLENYADAIRGKLNFNGSYPIKSEVAASAADLDVNAHLDLLDTQIELSFVEISRGRDFEVDNFLNLTVPYRYSYAFTPRITRRLFSGGAKSEPLTSGRLRLTFVFFAAGSPDFATDTRYLTSVQTEANVSASGRVTGVLEVKYPHMLFASGRQTVLVEVNAPDQRAVEPGAFAGSVSTVDQKGTISLVPDARDAELIHRDSTATRAARARARGKPYDEYLASHDVTHTVTDDVLDLKKNSDQSGSTLDAVKAWAVGRWLSNSAKLCRAYLKIAPGDAPTAKDVAWTEDLGRRGDSVEYLGCDPGARMSDTVAMKQLDFVDALADPAPRNVAIRTYSNMDFATYTTRDTVQSSTKTIGLNVSMPLLPLLNATASVTDARVNVTTRGGKFGESQTVAVDVGTMEIRASVRHCVLITSGRAIEQRPPWLICETKPRAPRWHPEQYYYFSQMFGSNHSPFIDPFNAESGIKALVRDQSHMRSLVQALADVDARQSGFNLIIDLHAPNFNEFDTLGKLDALTNQGAPGAFEE